MNNQPDTKQNVIVYNKKEIKWATVENKEEI